MGGLPDYEPRAADASKNSGADVVVVEEVPTPDSERAYCDCDAKSRAEPWRVPRAAIHGLFRDPPGDQASRIAAG